MSVYTHHRQSTSEKTNQRQFFIAPWQESTGWTWTFTTQALIVVVLSGTGLAALQRFGASWRARAPVPAWVNAEFDS